MQILLGSSLTEAGGGAFPICGPTCGKDEVQAWAHGVHKAAGLPGLCEFPPRNQRFPAARWVIPMAPGLTCSCADPGRLVPNSAV